ncbi:MAG TPA: transposase [Bacteroidales bacterium]|nr:transposase [Bacteroidales bacterium]
MSKIFNNDIDDEKIAELFLSDEKCYEFLADLKWSEGFTCRKCGNTNYCQGKTPYSRRCTRCKSEESPTSGTIFHNCKFPISKAFYIAYNVCKGKEDVSTYEFARRLSLRQMTCWNFKVKIQNALNTMSSLTATEKSSIEKMLL